MSRDICPTPWDDDRAGRENARALNREQHIAWHLAGRHSLGRLLELERLLVDVNACIRHNDVGVWPAIHPLPVRLHDAALILIAELRQGHRAERSRASDRLAMVAARAPRDDGDGFRTHACCRDHDP